MALHVLIVDDSAVSRKMIARTLEMSGLDIAVVHEAGDGNQALEVLEHNWMDLALVDINMPNMNGEELVMRLRARPETAMLPVVVVSTEGSETRIAKMHTLGAEFVRKPFSPEGLRVAVMGLLGVEDA